MSKRNLDAKRRAEINTEIVLKNVSSTGAVGVEILLAVGQSARRQGKCIKL